jgi:hypothetical protein
VVTVEDIPSLVPGIVMATRSANSRVDQVPDRGPPEVVAQPPTHPGRLARRLPGLPVVPSSLTLEAASEMRNRYGMIPDPGGVAAVLVGVGIKWSTRADVLHMVRFVRASSYE